MVILAFISLPSSDTNPWSKVPLAKVRAELIFEVQNTFYEQQIAFEHILRLLLDSVFPVFCVDEERLPLLPRLLFWFWLLFALYTALRLLQGEDTAMYRFISWNEFYHDMLAKGEVTHSHQSVTFRMELSHIRTLKHTHTNALTSTHSLKHIHVRALTQTHSHQCTPIDKSWHLTCEISGKVFLYGKDLFL